MECELFEALDYLLEHAFRASGIEERFRTLRENRGRTWKSAHIQ
jgi:hypothetical protein